MAHTGFLGSTSVLPLVSHSHGNSENCFRSQIFVFQSYVLLEFNFVSSWGETLRAGAEKYYRTAFHNVPGP